MNPKISLFLLILKKFFSLFFQDFDYKILDVNVDKDKQSAQANLRLVTLDAHALAEDFSKAQLKHEIPSPLPLKKPQNRLFPLKSATLF